MLTIIVWEVVLHWADWQLLFESINFVQEQNYAGLDEPSRVTDAVEEGEGFLHTVDRFVFEKQLVVFGDGYQEKDCGNIFEAMNPLLSF